MTIVDKGLVAGLCAILAMDFITFPLQGPLGLIWAAFCLIGFLVFARTDSFSPISYVKWIFIALSVFGFLCVSILFERIFSPGSFVAEQKFPFDYMLARFIVLLIAFFAYSAVAFLLSRK